MNTTLLSTVSLLIEKEPALVFKIVLLILVLIVVFLTIVVVYVVLRGSFNFFEMAQVELFKKKQFYTHAYLKKRTLHNDYKSILKEQFGFYNRLTLSEQKNFEHRLQYYLKKWEFIGKEIEVNKTMKVMIAATAAKLTFGFRHYKIDSVNKIIIYPKTYFSKINKQWHKGEFNMAYQALIFSWEDFKKGYAISNDNLNLGVHECIHAIHFSFLKSRKYSTSSAIFLDSFHELLVLLDANQSLKKKLVTSGYLRDYAYENQYEFISVIVENFIETPLEFQSQFPVIYGKVKQMLNFDFSGY
ncbi:zinc-dependent peptidase [Lacinutrix sp.]|uniref:zinc-dependent peptidase n=1 Tax=Lacinutrix sp. TaxID=1937692 RepID=UPI0026289211|nr:zinc-dependent peptidase [Lacinutrix sp.]MDG1715793.1 zinc-dependent peptidase [Lacinutrix sp.]